MVISLRLGQRCIELIGVLRDEPEIHFLEGAAAQAAFQLRYAQERRHRNHCAFEAVQRLPGQPAQLRLGAAGEPALEAGAHHRERRPQVVRDVVTDALQLGEQTADLIEHRVDRAHQLVDVVRRAAGRQTLAQLAAHHTLDSVFYCRQASRRTHAHERAEAQCAKDDRHDGDCKSAQHGASKLVGRGKAAPEDEYAAIWPCDRDDDRLGGAGRIGLWGRQPQHVRRPIMRYVEAWRDVADHKGAVRIIKPDIVDMAYVLGQAQTQPRLEPLAGRIHRAAHFALEHARGQGHVRAIELQVDEREYAVSRQGQREREGDGDLEGGGANKPPQDEVSGPSTTSRKPMPRTLTIRRGSPSASILRRRLPTWTSTTLVWTGLR